MTQVSLSEREAAALARLRKPATGQELADQMRAAGRETSPAAAHQAGSALADPRRGLASESYDGPVRYEITALGRQLAHRIGGGR